MAVEHVTVFLLKKSVGSPNDGLRPYPSERLLRVPIEDLNGATGELVVKLPAPARPQWLDLLDPILGARATPLNTTSLSAVLFLRTSGRWFAISFGYGRTMLAPKACEPNFGMRVVVNSVNPDSLKSVDAKTLDDLAVYTRRQLSKGSSITTFGLDLHRDLLKGLAGDPRDETFAQRLAGSLALVIDAELELADLPRKCREALAFSRKKDYKTRFGWVDHLQVVTDPDEIEELDRHLNTLLSGLSADDVHLAPPEITDPEDFGGFRYSTDPSTVENDLSWSDYLQTLKGKPGLVHLKRDEVGLISAASGNVIRRWRIYDCVVIELGPKGAGPIHVLTGGDWFKVETSYAKTIAAEIAPYVVDPEPLLCEANKGEREDDYNLRAAAALAPAAAVLDRKLVAATDSQDNIEFCDVLLAGCLVHVKKKSGSSTLSHLFQQGLVSADLIQTDVGFHSRLCARIDEARLVDGFDAGLVEQLRNHPIDPSKLEIAFGVIARKPAGKRHFLPFFSQVTFARAASELTARGFPVSLRRINIS